MKYVTSDRDALQILVFVQDAAVKMTDVYFLVLFCILSLLVHSVHIPNIIMLSWSPPAQADDTLMVYFSIEP